MKTILHHQNVSSKVNDIFVIDGVVSVFGSDKNQYEAIRKLNNNRFRIKKLWYPQPHSESLKMQIGINELYISAKSKTKDEMGRFITYEFYISSYNDVEETLSSLQNSVKISGLEMNENDILEIRSILNTLPLEKMIAATAIGVCILIPLLLTFIR